jgi:hypothetical protein
VRVIVRHHWPEMEKGFFSIVCMFLHNQFVPYRR